MLSLAISICPGRFLNDRKGFSLVATILWAFKIEQAPGTARLDPANPAFVDALVS